MNYFPFFFDLRDKRVLLVGGGDIALRKAELLTRAQARCRVVAPHIDEKLTQLVEENNGEIIRRRYHADDVRACLLVVSATDDDALNRQVAADARQQRIPVNVVDCPSLCDFIFPAIIDRAPVIVAVSSSGASPVLARRLRAKIEALLPTAIGQLADFCERMRARVQAALPIEKRRLFWEDMLDDAVAQTAPNDKADASKENTERFERLLARHQQNDSPTGEVYLIGAGPGDADLLTFHALRLLQRADVVVHDRLVSKSVLELARRDAEKIHVGKRRRYQNADQDEINALLVSLARKGLRVARLKGGDPFIFGRGGEEKDVLDAAGIPVQIASGITAAMGCAAAAGIPLTHRNIARSVRFCTAYRRDLSDKAHWRRLAADTECTLVFYMTGATLSAVCDELLHAGRTAQTPVAVISAGATAAQQVITSTLADIGARAADDMFSPTLIIIGDVVHHYRATAENRGANTVAFPFLDLNKNEPYADRASTANS